MEQSTIIINGKEVTIRYLSFEKFCAKFYSYIHEHTIADIREDYENSRALCDAYAKYNAYYDATYFNYSFYKTVLLYITSQCPCISGMYDVYKADRLRGDTVL